jgi:drug/metabolite transporter (DMT)-like permease
MKWLSLLVPVICGTFYHLGQKKLRADLSPFILFSIIYFISMALMFLTGVIQSNTSFLTSLRSLTVGDWRDIALISLGIIGIELGFLFVYRLGLPLNSSALIVNGLMGMSLLLIGVFFTGEKINTTQFIGLAFTIIGMGLVTFKGS